MSEWKDGITKINLPTPFAVGDVNVYLIKGERLTLVDCGVKTKESWVAFKKQLADLHLTPDDIEQVIITHHHVDHVGMLDFLSDNIEVYGHSLNERWINPTDAFFEEQEKFFGAQFLDYGLPQELFPSRSMLRHTLKYSCNRSLTGELSEGMNPPGLSEWTVIETPGHAQSQIALFREKDGVLIGGDLILAHISPNPFLETPAPGEKERPKPQLQHNHSMKKLLSYPIQFVYTGHGDEVFQLKELIEKRLIHQHERAMKVNNWLKEDQQTVFALCKRLFPSAYKRELMLTLSETVGQLDYLASIGEIISIKDNHPVLYQAR
ncbi:glyoxylase-like metal-dependent hydrolase (beta-lactamase superfamily II) [Neobacillus niacini]|uniref:MBL fold metallo-hydrolase n=1 Tax=Neobacillus niacini TaxID=86668 RepID=UPI002862BA42|nr:MBL fold metallo-hydrolase [Neobacillus niacini]MDR7075174.1 glyoxylase-like metal-dependent hydrolase (beta-lactamase superfamily II) [Neobacillus niacini]